MQKYLKGIDNPLDLQKFCVQVFPFETDNEKERYKAVRQAVNDFVGSLTDWKTGYYRCGIMIYSSMAPKKIPPSN